MGSEGFSEVNFHEPGFVILNVKFLKGGLQQLDIVEGE